MTTGVKNANGHLHPSFHAAGGGFAEELFHYTSRYFGSTEGYLRNLSQDHAFAMSGYQAQKLGSGQRDLMAAVLLCHPDREAGVDLVAIVSAVAQGDLEVGPAWLEPYRGRLEVVSAKDAPACRFLGWLREAAYIPLRVLYNFMSGGVFVGKPLIDT